jgi:hypothetical protein
VDGHIFQIEQYERWLVRSFSFGNSFFLFSFLKMEKKNSFCNLFRIYSRIVCRGQEDPKGSKGTLRLDFQANS